MIATPYIAHNGSILSIDLDADVARGPDSIKTGCHAPTALTVESGVWANLWDSPQNAHGDFASAAKEVDEAYIKPDARDFRETTGPSESISRIDPTPPALSPSL